MSTPVRNSLAALSLLTAAACASASPAPQTQPPSHEDRDPPPVEQADFDVHEWGVVTAHRGGAAATATPRVAAPPVVVEKPVLYFHAEGPFETEVRLELAEGVSLRERYPASDTSAWRVRGNSDACPGLHSYPPRCETVDQICETASLPIYETDDAACLQVGEAQLPLLFYRLGMQPNQNMPVEVRVEGVRVSLRARSGTPISAMRVSGPVNARRAIQFSVGGEWSLAPEPNEPPVRAADALSEALREGGLAPSEIGAFQRGWWEPFFGITVADRARPNLDRPTETTPTAEEEIPPQETPPLTERSEGLPDLDVLLYVLPDEALERMVRLNLTPAARSVHRVFVVRQVL